MWSETEANPRQGVKNLAVAFLPLNYVARRDAPQLVQLVGVLARENICLPLSIHARQRARHCLMKQVQVLPCALD